jgi:predicted permease
MVSLPGAEPKPSRILTVGSSFFRTMQIPIRLGREMDERDRTDSPLVAVVNETFAKNNFADESPIGRHLALPRSCPKCEIEIVGVSANVLYGGVKEPVWPTVFLPFTQGVWGPAQGMAYELRTTGNPLRFVDSVREIVHQADERVPLSEVKTQNALIDRTISQEIAFARLCTAFAILALTIACVGLYGTMSYNVARRTSEIGIRMALGAKRGRVVWMVLREVLLLVVIGLAISIPAALASTKLVESYLFGMKRNDPLTLTVTALVLVCAAALAGYFPARNASRIDPMRALRHE